MHQPCPRCSAENAEHARFCAKCGAPLTHGHPAAGTHQKTPAQQGAELLQKTKKTTGQLKARTQDLWSNFALGEKIMAAGALGLLVSFVLPWASMGGESISGVGAGQMVGYAYLLPLSAVASLALLYFTQGATREKKLLGAAWQTVIGTAWAAVSLLAIVSVRSVIDAMTGGYGAASGFQGGLEFGFYLLTAGSVAIVAGAIKLQTELLRGS
jgi:hypothetical protein